jgi:hypothetical protein
MKSIMKWALRAVAAVFLSFIAILVITVLINLYDEPLKPEVTALMREPDYVVRDDQNGYFLLRAIDADASLDAYETGLNIVNREEALFRENPARSNYNVPALQYKKIADFDWNLHRCDQTLENCAHADLKNRNQLMQLLAKNAILLKRYELMQKLGEFEEHPIPAPAAMLPAYGPLVKASNMITTQAEFEIADGKLDEGIHRLQKNDRFLRLLLQKSSTLISRMIAVAMMRQQVRTVSDLVEMYPQLAKQYGESLSALVRPLTTDEQAFSSVFSNEARFLSFFQYLNVDDIAPADADLVELPRIFTYRINRFFFNRNATLNLMGESRLELIKAANQKASRYDELRQQIADKEEVLIQHPNLPYVHYLYNPLGKILFTVGSTSDIYFSYLERSADLDGYLRLAGLQIDIRRKNLQESEIETYIASAPEPFRSPYDGKPMTWDAKAKQLQFIGRHKATSNPGGGNVFIVSMR